MGVKNFSLMCLGLNTEVFKQKNSILQLLLQLQIDIYEIVKRFERYFKCIPHAYLIASQVFSTHLDIC